MRRSLAPSQLAGPSKKPRLEQISTPASKASTPAVKKTALNENSTPQSSSFKSTQDILALLEKKPSTISNTDKQHPKLEWPTGTPTRYLANVRAPRQEVENTESEPIRYFNVFWCKASAKKHKNWEEEAFLVVKTRAVFLKSIEGKEIGQASGFKLAELQKLESGSTLKVGGREVLIHEEIDEASYLKQKDGSTPPSKEPTRETQQTKPRAVANKNFVPPASRNPNDELSCSGTVEIKPRHNPAGANALVMPRPPSDIQWREAQRGTVIIDVVVDPLLCKHLRPHQRDGVTFLYECLMGFKTPNMYGAVLADEMGLGKTLQCITVIWTLLNQGPYNGRPVVQRVLVVAPSSLVKNWHKEFRRWLGRERLEVFTADQQNRPVDFLKQRVSRVMIVSYEMFLRSFDEIQQVNFDLIVCDEGHRLKNSGNKTSSLLAQLDADRKILLTGTPVQNDLKEFYALADFVNPGIFGTLSSFRKTYEEPILALQLPDCPRDLREAGENCATELSLVTSRFVLRRTQEVMSAHLPPKVENVIFCRPSSVQIEMYHSLLESSACRSLLTSSYSGNDLLGFIQTLRKLCNHPMLFKLKNENVKETSAPLDSDFDEDSNDSFLDLYQKTVRKDNYDSASIEDSGKFMVTLHILDSIMQLTREKIVLVSYSTKMLDLFGEACTQRKYGWLRLDGSTQATTRMGLVDKFNDPTGLERVFLLSSKAGGVGLNLIGASRLVLYDIDWNPANDLQAMARIWRDGQKRTVHIYRLLSTGTIEEKIFQRQVLKQGLSGAVVDSRDSSKGHFTRDELKDLFTLRKDTNCDTHDLIQCNCCFEDGQPIDHDEQDADLDDERDCQIGTATTKSKEAHKTVDQLMDWRHYAPPFYDRSFEDDCMDAAKDDITFVFRCTSGFEFE